MILTNYLYLYGENGSPGTGRPRIAVFYELFLDSGSFPFLPSRR